MMTRPVDVSVGVGHRMTGPAPSSGPRVSAPAQVCGDDTSPESVHGGCD